MGLTSSFTCPNGHTFTAIAKLRARCPTCGATTRRDFTKPTESPTKNTIIRSSHKVVTPKVTETGSKPDLITTKVKSLRSTKTDTSVKSPISNKPSPRIIRQGNLKPVVRSTNKSIVKSVIRKPVTSSPTKKISAPVGSHPTVGRKPTGSRERKTVARLAEIKDVPFWLKVKKKYFV